MYFIFARPDDGISELASRNGDCFGTALAAWVTLDGARTCIATFRQRD